MNKRFFLVCLLVVALALAACGGNGDESAGSGDDGPVGDAANGEALFAQATIGSAAAPGCASCHNVEGDEVKVGPSLAGLADRAGERVAGLGAEEYIRQSIMEPNAYVVEGFVEGVMYQNFGQELTEAQIDDLVAYLLTLD